MSDMMATTNFRLLFIDKTEKQVELIPICPEVAIDLGVPRTPIELIRSNGLTKLAEIF